MKIIKQSHVAKPHFGYILLFYSATVISDNLLLELQKKKHKISFSIPVWYFFFFPRSDVTAAEVVERRFVLMPYGVVALMRESTWWCVCYWKDGTVYNGLEFTAETDYSAEVQTVLKKCSHRNICIL